MPYSLHIHTNRPVMEYIHLYSRQEATAHVAKIETEKNKVTYINRQLAVNKLKRSTYLVEFTPNIQCCQSRKQNQTVLFFQEV